MSTPTRAQRMGQQRRDGITAAAQRLISLVTAPTVPHGNVHLTRYDALQHRASQPSEPDGWPAGGGEPVAGGETSNPTLAAVIARTHKPRPDPVLRCGREAETLLASILRDINRLSGLVALGLSYESDEVLAAPGSGTCECCGRYCPGGPDRIVGGMCDTDRKAWDRAVAGGMRQDDRRQWIRERQKRTQEADRG